MTPKEKAKELYHKFQVYEVNGQKIMKYGPEVKVFALIAVDEIITTSDKNKIVYTFFEGDCLTQYTEDFYWEKVKEEINKL